MTKYLLIESRSPYESGDVAPYLGLAGELAGRGNEVTLYLVQNGVMAARAGARDAGLAGLAEAGVEVLADDFSLAERGIPDDGLAAGVAAAPLEVVVDQLAEGRKAIWH